MSVRKTIVEDWTGPYQFQLLEDGSPVDLTGVYRVEIILWPRAGTAPAKRFSVGVGGNGKAQIDDVAKGKVSMLPAEGDILVIDSPYWVQIEVWWSPTQHSVYPSALPPHPNGVELEVYARAR